MQMTEETTWYAIYTKPRWEKKVAKLLDQRGVTSYCPLNKVTRQWSDRKKVILEPIFKSYVFVKVGEDKKWDLMRTDGVLNYVHWLGKPAKIKDEEIDTIRKFLGEFEDVEVQEINVAANSKVRIKRGVLMNYEGMVLEISGSLALVRIESMGLQLSAKFDKNNLERVL